MVDNPNHQGACEKTKVAAHLRYLQGHPAHLHALEDHRSRLQHGQCGSHVLHFSGGKAGGLGLSFTLPGKKTQSLNFEPSDHRLRFG